MSGAAGTTWRVLVAEIASVIGSDQEARFICEHAAGLSAGEFVAVLDELPTNRMATFALDLAQRRRGGEPLQYVLGRWSFRHLDLLVDRRVLIPRPETEQVAQVALDIARSLTPTRLVVDLGTGSGAIGLSLAQELPIEGTTVWLTDASTDALDVARANLAGLGRPGQNVRLAQGDWFAALDPSLRGCIDVVVANPPYIAIDDPEVAAEVTNYEPRGALFAGDDGLDALRVVIGGASEWLRPGGALVLEIGHRQGGGVRDLLVAGGLERVEIRRDYAGRDRIAIATRRLHEANR